MAPKRRKGGPQTLAEYMPTFEKMVRSRLGREHAGLATGFARLDEILNGWQGVGVLGGAPGVGKTTLALQLACQVVEHNEVPALILSFEMFRQQLAEKMLSRMTAVPHRHVAMGLIYEDSDYDERLAEGLAQLNRIGEQISVVDKADNPSLEDVAESIESTRNGAERIFVVIDSLQNAVAALCDGTRGHSFKERLDDLMIHLYELAYEEQAELLVISHVPKSQGDRSGDFMYAGSGGIDFEADVTLGLSRPARERSRANMRRRRQPLKSSPERRVLSISKNRFGPPGEVPLEFLGDTSSFKEVP